MMLHRTRKSRLILPVGGLIAMLAALWLGCSDRPVDSGKDAAAGSLNLQMKLASTELADYIDSVRVTIVPSDRSGRIVTTLAVINGGYEGQIPEVPAGPALLIVEAIDANSGMVVYRDERTIFVRSDQPTEAPMVLQPYGRLVRLSPRTITTSAGQEVSTVVQLFRVPWMTRTSFQVWFNGNHVIPDSITPAVDTTEVSVSGVLDPVGYPPRYYAVTITRSEAFAAAGETNELIDMARIWWTTLNPNDVPATSVVRIDSLALNDDEGNDYPTDSIFTDRCMVTLVDTVVTDAIPPSEVTDLAVDSVAPGTIYLSWTAPGDDRRTGQAAEYDIRWSPEPLTATGFSEADTVADEPSPAVAGTVEQFVLTDIDFSDTIWVALRTADEQINWSGVSNVVMAVAPDVTPPAAITDLEITEQLSGEVTLGWTAPGDDGTSGQASEYDLRWSNQFITESNFSSATRVSVESPETPGTTESVAVAISTDTVRYFAIKTGDEVSNWSALSNVVATIPPDTVAPAGVNDLDLLYQTDSSVTLSWTAVGDDSTSGQASLYDLRYYNNPINDINFDSTVPVTDVPAPSAAGIVETVMVAVPTASQQYIALKVGDETVNWSPLSNVVVTLPPDSVAPAAITDLAVSSVDDDSVTLAWTAPGDNNLSGTAYAYDIRLSTSPISEANFDDATVVSTPLYPEPLVVGTPQSVIVTSLDGETDYYFAIKTVDQRGNWSPLSNVVEVTTLDGLAPGRIADLEVVEHSSVHIQLRWTAPGDDEFSGAATQYDLRWSTDSASLAGWNSAVLATGEPTPQPAGQEETYSFEALSPVAATYYFAVRAADERPNWSAISNIARVDIESAVFEDPNLEQAVRDQLGLPTEGLLALIDVQSMDSLYAEYYGITSLDGLEHASSLRWLLVHGDSEGTGVSDSGIAALSGLTNLEYLSLYGNMLGNVSALSDLTGLTHLSLGSNDIVDLSPLSGLINLDFLDVRFNNVGNLSTLSGLTGLDTLWLDYNGLTSLTGIDNLSGLQNLSFGGNSIADVSPLAPLRSLKRLKFSRISTITDINALVENDSLRYVDFTGCSVEGLYPVGFWSQLDTLIAQSNEIVDIYHTLNSGLDEGDYLDIRYNYDLDSMSLESYIPTLISRGVIVDYSGGF